MRKCNTRSHSELGSQAFLRQWYFVLRHGRVGHCQAISANENIIIVTGGAGFVGSNLIEYLLKKQKKIISVDNYSTGYKKNHIKNKRVKYLKLDTSKIDKLLVYKKEYTQYFILENLPEFIKVLKILINALTLIR